MHYTPAAQKILHSIEDRNRRQHVASYARHMVEFEGRNTVTKADMETALLVAAPEFLPSEKPGTAAR